METKKLYLANFNVTFGDEDEPLLTWLDEFVLPAMQMKLERTLSDKKSKVMFKNVKVGYLEEELVVTGIIIKDTELEVYSQLDSNQEIVNTNKILPSAPLSIFLIYLKNHRMFLVRNQKGSPDLRLFSSTFEYAIKEYRKIINKSRRENKQELLPYAIASVKGIKQVASIDDALKNVKKITKVTMKLKPTNNEFMGMDSLLGSLEENFSKKIAAKTTKVSATAPQSIKGVKEVIKQTNGVAEIELGVEYHTDDYYPEGEKKKKAVGRIKDGDMTKAIDIEVNDNLTKAYKEVSMFCKGIEEMCVETPNIVEYEKYLQKRKMRDGSGK